MPLTNQASTNDTGRAAPRSGYRWAVLAAGTLAQSGFSVVGIGLPAIAPALRDEYGLSLAEIGVVLSGVWIGATLTLLPWGYVADRFGERWTLASGLFACGLGLAAVAWADDLATLLLLLSLAGAAGASVNAASGRAVMAWFGPQERGLALGVRQGAIPIGGVLAALALPAIERAGGVDAAFVAIGGFTCFGAIVGALVIRDRPHEHIDAHDAPWTLRDGRIWRLSGAGGLYVVAQMALIGFVVLYLHDERGWSNGEAALVLAVIQVIALPARIVAGAWSDRTGRRVAPLRHIGVATFATTALVAVVLDAPAVLLVGAFVVAGVLSMAWNGLSYTAAIELAGRTRAGAAIGFQQTTLSIAGLVAPVAFAAAVSATSWRAAFAVAALCPLVGALMLRPLRV